MQNEISLQEQSEVKELLNGLLGKDWQTKTELTRDEIIAINSLLTIINYAKEQYNLDISILKTSISQFMQLKISLKRKSRNEAVQVLAKKYAEMGEEDENKKNAIEDMIG